MKLVAVLGYHEGNAGQTAEWLEQATGLRIAAFADEGAAPPVIDADAENRKRVSQRMEYPSDGKFKGKPLLVSPDWPARLKSLRISRVVPLVSENSRRRDLIRRALESGFELVSAIHPTATILDQAIVDPGAWINARAVIGYKAEVRSGAMVNTGAQIDHHSILEHCCQVDPGVITAGHVTVRELAHVHTGAVIINRITVGRGAVVGAGAVVIEDVPEGSTVVGVPARVVKR